MTKTLAQRAADELMWQDIETLIPDGITSYVLWDGEMVYTGWQDSKGKWNCDQWADHCSEVDVPPTHWQPLPAPPNAQTPDQE